MNLGKRVLDIAVERGSKEIVNKIEHLTKLQATKKPIVKSRCYSPILCQLNVNIYTIENGSVLTLHCRISIE